MGLKLINTKHKLKIVFNNKHVNFKMFQACSEMVMPMCSTTDEMFEEQHWNLTIYSDQCYKRWGVRPNTVLVLDTYGGARVSSFTNIVFSNGLLDPWSAGGVTSTNTTNSSNPRIRRSSRSTLPSTVLRGHLHFLDLLRVGQTRRSLHSTAHYFSRPFVVILIPGAAHHLDLRASNPIDPIAVTNARIIHRSEIRRWLDTYYTEE